MHLKPGDVVERYSIVGLLGEGGMGEVYRARDPKLQRHIALKILREGGELATDGRARLLREARAVAALSHPNVLAVHDAGEVQEPERLRGVAYIAMELVLGSTLRARVGDASISIERRVEWLRDVARALAAAHEVGLVHRDVKPENVMIRSDGIVKVLDFGIARRVTVPVDPLSSTEGRSLSMIAAHGAGPNPTEGSSSASPAAREEVVGTLFYMAPEQLRGEPIDAAIDQFAWGVVAFELLVGKPPWTRGQDAISIVSQILSHEPRSVAEIDPRIPRAVSDAIARAMSKQASNRFASMNALLASLETTGDREDARVMTSPAAETAPVPIVRAPSRRSSSRWALGGAALAVLLCGAVFFASRAGHAPVPVPAAATADTPIDTTPEEDSFVRSPNPEATRLFLEALRSLHDGTGEASALLKRAVEIDPGFASAHLRLAIVGDDPKNESFRRAVALQTSLRPRERVLLDAHEAAISGGDAARSAASALDRLLEKHPHDEVAWIQRWALEENCAAADAVIERALAANPAFVHALAAEVSCHILEPRALALVNRCLSAAPRAVECLVEHLEYDAFNDACGELEVDARKVLLLQPENRIARDALANALAAGGAPIDAIREAIGPLDGPTRRDSYAQPRAIEVPMFQGDFVEVERIAREMLKSAATSRELQDHLQPTSALLAALDESGEVAEAARVAEDFAMRSNAWGMGPSDGEPHEGGFLAVMARGGRLSRAEAAARRGDLARRLAARDLEKIEVWGMTFGSSVRTTEEAQRAVAAFDEAGLSADTDQWTFNVTHAFVLAGEPKRLPRAMVERLANNCGVVTTAVMHVRAQNDLARYYEAYGERDAACARYAKVIAQWGNARPRSVTAEDAKARSKALGCGGT